MKRTSLRWTMLALCLGAGFAANAQVLDMSFTCKVDGEGTPVVRYYVSGGNLYSAQDTRSGRPPNYGRVTITEDRIIAHQAQPLLTDGTGWAETSFSISRDTGRFELNIHASRPGRAPVNFASQGLCHGLPENVGGLGEGGANHSGQTHKNQESSNNGSASNQEDARQDEERDRLERERDAQIAREQREAEAEAKRKEEQARVDREKEEAERRAIDERIAAERGLRNTFRGHATTCPGGGKDVFYLQTSTPPKTGCRVRFQAHCALSLNTMVFVDQANYVGGSCMGVGDIIKLGEMPCKPEDVQIEMVSATCR